jgi:hypothetical protein
MNNLVIAVVVTIVIMLILLVEEILKGFRMEFPLGKMPRNTFILIKVLIYLFAGITLALVISGSPAAVVLAWILAVAMMATGVWLLIQMLVRSGYFPGGYSAFFVLLASIYLMTVLA